MKCHLEHAMNNKLKKASNLELLAPAGGMEQFMAAINFGADAVYVGLGKFSMRAKAHNFTFEELEKAVEIAHDAGVSVHVTMNVQMREGDGPSFAEHFEKIEACGADAVIVGDVGAMQLAKKHAPNVDLHVSTQAAVANSESAKFFYEMGAKRVVLAREMTVSEIAALRKKVPDDLEIEVFAHGAQCMAESGRCLISAYLCDGRSANAGACTQPCRWGYHLVEEKRPNMEFDIEEAGGLTYLFNAQDLCMIEHLRELEEAGVNSIKIEGRNKKAFYVATVVNAYRMALNGEGFTNPYSLVPNKGIREQGLGISRESPTIPYSLFPSPFNREDPLSELNAVSHRPFSTGFFYGNPKQSLDFDGYTQETLHVADVLACEKVGDEFKLQIRCRNKILDGEDLEALVPKKGVRHVRVLGFLWNESPQAEVNRPGEVYTVTSNVEVPSGSFLRKREKRTTSRMIK